MQTAEQSKITSTEGKVKEENQTKGATVAKASVYYTEKALGVLDPRGWVGSYYGFGARFRTRRAIELHDGRARATDLDRNGFELGKLPAILRRPKEEWLEARTVAQELFASAEQVLEARYPGTKALVFDHIVRGVPGSKLSSQPVPFVHNDYSIDSGAPRIKALLADFADKDILEEVASARVAIVNLWAPLSAVERDPLAFVDWTSTRPEDLAVVRIQYSTRVGETSVVYPNDKHEWVWYPDMVPGEAILLKTWDSADSNDPARSRFAVHSSAELQSNDVSHFFGGQPEAPPRESIELRAMVLFHAKAKTDLLTRDFVAPHIARLDDPNDGEGFEKRVSTNIVDGRPDAFVPVSALVQSVAA